MKFVLVTYRRPKLEKNGKSSGLRYPALFNAEEVKVNADGPHIYDELKGFDSEDKAELLILIKDELADKYAEDPLMRIITPSDADAWLLANTTVQSLPDFEVHDATVRAIQLRVDAGLTPSAAELEAIDPGKDRVGIRTRLKDRFALFGLPREGS